MASGAKNSILISVRTTASSTNIYDGTTYAQLPGMIWLAKTDYSPEYRNSPEYYLNPDEAVSRWMQDKNARIVSFEH